MEEQIDNRVLIVKIDRVEAHPNADRLDLVHISGWQCVTQRGTFTDGDLAVYIPIDSVLPPDLESLIFPVGSKVKLSGSRVKTIKLRGAISQGMALSINTVRSFLPDSFDVGTDVTESLNVTHYEPPAPPATLSAGGVAKKAHSFFPEYGKLSHFKNYPHLFEEGEVVVVTEKIHGTNFRAGWVPTEADTIWKRVKRFFGTLPEWEFVVGSHHVNISRQKDYKGFYPSNVYNEIAQQYDLEGRIPLATVVYGEIYGDGVQKGYTYGLCHGQRELRLFDVLVLNRQTPTMFLDWERVESIAVLIGVPTVPVVYKGPYRAALRSEWEQGVSLIFGEHGEGPTSTQAHREGCVIKPVHEQSCWIGRKVLRSINPEYLLISESDWH